MPSHPKMWCIALLVERSTVNECSYFNSSWQQEFWGRNHPKLRSIKTKNDQDGLFFVHHGVGSEEWSADGFTRLA